MNNYKAVKTVCVVLLVFFTALAAVLLVLDKAAERRRLSDELELYKTEHRIKEANLKNIGLNKEILIGNRQSVLTDLNEIVFAALHIGERVRERGFADTSYNTDRYVNAAESLVTSRITCGFNGNYAEIMDFLRSIRDEKYYYRFDRIQLSSAGMPNGWVSAKIELLVFSALNSESGELDADANYYEGYGYENPFYYD